MKTNKILILTMAAALAVGGFTVLNTCADGVSEGQGAFRGRFLQRIKEKLGLTQDQTTQIKAVLKADKDNLTALMTRMHQARVDLRQAIRATNASEVDVRTASAKVAAVESDMAVERMKLFAKISPILTQEQRDKPADMEQRMDDLADYAIARAGQRVQMHNILAGTHQELKDLRQEFRPRFATIISEADGKISAILTPEQLGRFEKLKAENPAIWQAGERKE